MVEHTHTHTHTHTMIIISISPHAAPVLGSSVAPLLATSFRDGRGACTGRAFPSAHSRVIDDLEAVAL